MINIKTFLLTLNLFISRILLLYCNYLHNPKKVSIYIQTINCNQPLYFINKFFIMKILFNKSRFIRIKELARIIVKMKTKSVILIFILRIYFIILVNFIIPQAIVKIVFIIFIAILVRIVLKSIKIL